MLDVVVHAFNAGRTPEEIIQSYDTLQLEDVYAVLAYCLTHRPQVDACTQEQEEKAEAVWQEIRVRTDYREFRERLLARRNKD